MKIYITVNFETRKSGEQGNSSIYQALEKLVEVIDLNTKAQIAPQQARLKPGDGCAGNAPAQAKIVKHIENAERYNPRNSSL